MELGYCLKDCMVALARCDAVQEAALWLTEKRETLAAGKSFSVVFSIFFIWSYNCYLCHELTKMYLTLKSFTLSYFHFHILKFQHLLREGMKRSCGSLPPSLSKSKLPRHSHYASNICRTRVKQQPRLRLQPSLWIKR